MCVFFYGFVSIDTFYSGKMFSFLSLMLCFLVEKWFSLVLYGVKCLVDIFLDNWEKRIINFKISFWKSSKMINYFFGIFYFNDSTWRVIIVKILFLVYLLIGSIFDKRYNYLVVFWPQKREKRQYPYRINTNDYYELWSDHN